MKRLKEKLYQYEVNPPASTWDKIAAALDESMMNAEFPSVLYNLKKTPPAHVWAGIENTLDKDQPVIIPAKRRIIPVLRYAAAAAVLAFLIIAGIRLLNYNGGTVNLSGNDIPMPEVKIPRFQPVYTPADNNNLNTVVFDADDAALEESKHTMARLDLEPMNTTMAAFTDLNPEETYREMNYTGGLNKVAHQENLAVTANRYVMLITPDGNFIRMSKKLGNLVCCVSGEDEDPNCVDQISRWRKKLATSGLTSSPGNFMDILNLVKSLQDNSHNGEQNKN